MPGWPSFNLTEAELAVAFIRGLFVAALFSIFGASLFRILIAPAAMKLARGAATTEIDRRHHARASKLALIGSIAAETGLGLLVVLAAGMLSSLEPGMQAHA